VGLSNVHTGRKEEQLVLAAESDFDVDPDGINADIVHEPDLENFEIITKSEDKEWLYFLSRWQPLVSESICLPEQKRSFMGEIRQGALLGVNFAKKNFFYKMYPLSVYFQKITN